METNRVRVRFAPSPTGGLHLGGVRTALFNYLFAKQNEGTFVLRIEDTDQGRFVPGAEQYIIDCLNWCGIAPQEGPHLNGPYGPYRQSERKATYRQHAEQLISQGDAYYAFDTPEELEDMRSRFRTEANPSPQYDAKVRMQMKNSLSMSAEQLQEELSRNTPYVIRIKMPAGREVILNDMIRGEVRFNTDQIDDKVLLKADGMPTYHLAVVADDYAMKITHAFRGEEWLPSAPVHLLLWELLGWKENMPQWAHLPLILKPDGQGKLSKRDGDRLGFPVFAMDWQDPKSGEITKGFREMGFLPEAFINMLALLGWNDGTGEEILSLDELTARFTAERIQKGGAKFDFEKAKWFNQEWIKRSAMETLLPMVYKTLEESGIDANLNQLEKIIPLVKDRCQLLNDFVLQSSFFFVDPAETDLDLIRPKWDHQKAAFFNTWLNKLNEGFSTDPSVLEADFKEMAAAAQIKMGELQLPLRIMLVGGKFGPPVFEIIALAGVAATTRRVTSALNGLSSN